MLALLLATGLLVAISFVLGQALLFLCGWPWRWWAPALGFGLLLILFGQAVHHQTHLTLLTVAAAVAAIASLVLPAVRVALREAAPDGLPLAIGLTLVAAIPFFAIGHTGVLGATVSDDMSHHLTAAYWLRDQSGTLPVAAIGGDLITTGYPLGPHGIAAALASLLGIGEESAFSAVTLAVPVLTAFAALGLLPAARRGARWAFAAVVGLGYLPAAYLAQGSFKETIAAMLMFATAVALGDLPDGERLGWRRAIPVAVFAAAAVYAYSYGGLAWIGGLVVVFAIAEMIRRRTLLGVLRGWAPAALVAAIAGFLCVLPELSRINAFRHSIFGQESLKNHGNLFHALNPFETLGVWLTGDFRVNPDPRWATVLLCALALLALAGGLAWWWRRRALAVPAGVVAALAVWIHLTRTVNIYNAAKGLVVLAPLVMAALAAPLAAAWSAPRLWLVKAAGALLLVAALASSFAVLRSAPVGLGEHEQEFSAIRTLVRHKATLFLDNDHFGQWELRGARPLYVSNLLYAPARLPMHAQKTGGLPNDVDNFGARALDKVEFIVVSGGRYRSSMPPNFHLALRTRSYDVFRRIGPTAMREPIEPPGQPGTVLDCSSARAKKYLAHFKFAGVLPQPVVSTAWSGSIAKPGGSARLKVKLPRGRWDVSLQYLSATPVTLRAPGLTIALPANYGTITSYWPAGTLTSGGRPLTLSLGAGKRTWFGRLIGGPRPMRAPIAPGARPLWHAAFTRHGETPRHVPARQACGRYVDWFAPAR